MTIMCWLTRVSFTVRPARMKDRFQHWIGRMGRSASSCGLSFNISNSKVGSMSAMHDDLDLTVSSGRQDPDWIRSATIIDSLPA
jgi:hypothetical protein